MLNLPFYITTERLTFLLTQVKAQYKKLLIFTKPTQGYLRKRCFIADQNLTSPLNLKVRNKSWCPLTFCSLALKGLAYKILNLYVHWRPYNGRSYFVSPPCHALQKIASSVTNQRTAFVIEHQQIYTYTIHVFNLLHGICLFVFLNFFLFPAVVTVVIYSELYTSTLPPTPLSFLTNSRSVMLNSTSPLSSTCTSNPAIPDTITKSEMSALFCIVGRVGPMFHGHQLC